MSEKGYEYDDILELPRPLSRNHPPMSRENRAAQFAPFAALTGYEDAVKETARLTDKRIYPDENEKETLDRRLRLLEEFLLYRPRVSIRYFKEDARKSGGCYLTYEGVVHRLDREGVSLVFEDGTKIAFSDIVTLEGECFSIPCQDD